MAPDPDATEPAVAGEAAAKSSAREAPIIAEAHALIAAGRFGAALARIADELARRPGDPELLFERATTLFDWGRLREARAAFLDARAHGCERPALDLNLAWSCHLLGATGEAEQHALRVIAADPASAAAHFGLGAIQQRQGRHAEAVASFSRVLDLVPDHADAMLCIGACRGEERDYAGAEAWARRALAVAPHRPQPWANLAVALANQERYEDAIQAFRRADAIEAAGGEAVDSFVNHGYALILAGANADAATLYRRHLPTRPSPSGHRQYAFALLGLGRFDEGWDQYEYRWLDEPHLSHRPRFAQPPWVGQDLAGRSVLLRAEQGAGDVIQFARYAGLLEAQGATVLLQVSNDLRQLAARFAGVDRALGFDDERPAFDYYLHLMSAPRAFGTELATIPAAVPYVRADPGRLAHWAARCAEGRLRVGLAWAGNPGHARDHYRSLPFAALAPLFDVDGVRYFSLQKVPRAGEREDFPPEATMADLGPELADFDDTAAAIASLDLVVCVDTAIAHLAGALGKPVWLLLPAIGDFRWLEGRDDSPWYPTMRLFRQARLGAWDEVVARVTAALRDVVRGDGRALLPFAPAHRDDAALSPPAHRPAHRPEPPRDLARVIESRHGILQYLPDADDAARSLERYGEYLQAHLEAFASVVRPGACVLEVGSGIGAHTIPLARMAGTDGHVFAYEPRAIVQRLLRQNLDANRVGPIVTVMRGSLSGPHHDSSGSAADRGDGPAPAGTAEPTTPSETIDDLLLDRLDLVVVHGHVAADAILAGAAATLWRTRPVLFVGVPDARDLPRVAGQAAEFGYRCWRLETPLYDPRNFYRRDADLSAGATAVALLAIPEEASAAIVPDGCVEVRGAIEPAAGEHRPASGGDAGARRSADSARPGLLQAMRRRIFGGRQ